MRIYLTVITTLLAALLAYAEYQYLHRTAMEAESGASGAASALAEPITYLQAMELALDHASAAHSWWAKISKPLIAAENTTHCLVAVILSPKAEHEPEGEKHGYYRVDKSTGEVSVLGEGAVHWEQFDVKHEFGGADAPDQC